MNSIRPPKIAWGPEVKELFLLCLRKTGNVTKAARLCGGGRSYAYTLKKQDPEFSDDWDEAIQECVDDWKEEAARRAFHGVTEPVGFHLGKHGGTFVRKYSDNLATFLLEGERPEQYRKHIHHSGDATGGIAQQLARALARQAEREKLSGGSGSDNSGTPGA